MLIADLLKYLFVFTSTKEKSNEPITRTCDVNLHDKNQGPWCKEVNIFDATNDCYHI